MIRLDEAFMSEKYFVCIFIYVCVPLSPSIYILFGNLIEIFLTGYPW